MAQYFKFFSSFLFSALIMYVPLNRLQAQENPIILEKDTVLFRIENKVYLVSEANQLLAEIKKLDCFNIKLNLLEAIDISREELKNWPKYSLEISQIKLQQKWIERLVKLIKLKDFTLATRSQLTSLLPKDIDVRPNCLGAGKWSYDLSIFLAIEFFLNERFEKIANNAKQSVQDAAGIKRKQEILLFIETIDRKYEHSYYF